MNIINVERVQAFRVGREKSSARKSYVQRFNRIERVYSPLLNHIGAQQGKLVYRDLETDAEIRLAARRTRRDSVVSKNYVALDNLSLQLIDEIGTILKQDQDNVLHGMEDKTSKKVHHESVVLSTAFVESFNLSQGDPDNQLLIQDWLWNEYPEMRMTYQHIPIVRFIAFEQIRNRLQLKTGDASNTQLHPYYRPTGFLKDFLYNMRLFESHFAGNSVYKPEESTDTLVHQIAQNMIKRDNDYITEKRERKINGRRPQSSGTPLEINPQLSFTLDYMLGDKYNKFDPFKRLFSEMKQYVTAEIANHTLSDELDTIIARLTENRLQHSQKNGIDIALLMTIYQQLVHKKPEDIIKKRNISKKRLKDADEEYFDDEEDY